MGPITVTGATFFFSLVPKLTESSEKKRTEQTEPMKKKKEKKERKPTPAQERKKKKKSKGGQKLRLWVPYVYLITILSLSYELWKQSYCLPNKLFVMGLTIFEL